MYAATIKPSDLGKHFVDTHNGKRIWIRDVMGRIMAIDIGKRLYIHNGIVQVENQEQFEKRVKL